MVGAATSPPGTGVIVEARLDPEGTGSFGESLVAADGTAESITVELTHVYSRPGTYFPSLPAGSRRAGLGATAPVSNLALMRVVVS